MDLARYLERVQQTNGNRDMLLALNDEGFGAILTLHKQITDELVLLIRKWDLLEELMSDATRRVVTAYVDSMLSYLEQAMQKVVDQARASGTSGYDANQRRGGIISELQRDVEKVRAQYEAPVHAVIDALSAIETVGRGTDLERRVREFDQKRGELDSLVSDLETKQQAISLTLDKKVRADAVSSFADRAAHHKGAELCWAWASVVGGLLAACMIVGVFVLDAPASSTWDARTTGYLLQCALLIGAATAVVRLPLRRWSLERNLRIIYDHRVASLTQYVSFDATINPELHEAKDRLRLELVRMLFSDPATGYREENGSEVSISPIVNVVDQLGGKLKG